MSSSFLNTTDYQQFIQAVKDKVQSSQIKAAIAVNTELLRLYWFLGSQISEKQKTAQWGDGLIKQISKDLQQSFPMMKGFSFRNIKYMKQWFDFWNQELAIGQQVVAQLDDTHIFQIPWGQNLLIISKSQSTKEAVLGRIGINE